MDTNMLAGSEKQVKWAASVVKELQEKCTHLPTVQSSDFWIKHRNATLEEILEDSKLPVTTPFTSTYPYLSREDTLPFLTNIPPNLIVLDTETTGISKQGEVCEIAIVRYRDREILLNTLVKPLCIPDDNSKANSIHRIGYTDLIDAPTLPDIWHDLLAILQSHHITSYNTDFDLKMIRYSAFLHQIPVSPLRATCIMKLFTAYAGSDYWLSLEEAYLYFGVEKSTQHRALADTIATCEVIDKMVETIGVNR